MADSVGQMIRLMAISSYKLDKVIITNDLSKERPQWILSSYGPGRDAPIQLFGGSPREQSFEELRVRHYELAAQNNQQLAIQEAQNLVTNAEQQVQIALNDIDSAIKCIINGENEHPNRIDICKAKGASAMQPQIPSSNQPSAPSTFGQPSSSAQAFGQPSAPCAFGRPSVPTFGQPSAPVSAFGQPSTSTFGQASAFGQPAAPGRPTTSFGQPSSTFGKPQIPAPALGQSSAPTPFGTTQQKPSPFDVFASTSTNAQRTATLKQPSNPFGQSSAQSQPNLFGKPSAPARSSPFGLPLAPSQHNNFGNPSAPSTTDGLGQPQTSSPPVKSGQASTAPPKPFGQPTAPQTTSTFGQPSKPSPSPFGQPPSKARHLNANRPVPAFGFDINSLNFLAWPSTFSNSNTVQSPSATIANGAAPKPAVLQPTSGVQVQKDTQGKVRSWNGKPVSYIDDEPCYKGTDGSWQKLWFPDGPPIFTKTVDLPDEAYDEATKENYRHVKEYGTFKGGTMPDLPPRREWCTWNF